MTKVKYYGSGRPQRFCFTVFILIKSGTIKLLPLDFLGVDVEFHVRVETPFTICKYLH